MVTPKNSMIQHLIMENPAISWAFFPHSRGLHHRQGLRHHVGGMAHAAGAELLVTGLGATLHRERAADALLVLEPLGKLEAVDCGKEQIVRLKRSTSQQIADINIYIHILTLLTLLASR